MSSLVPSAPPNGRGRLNSLGLAKDPADTRVVVAMSGGVDSSVVAAMLKRRGYQVIGVTLQLYDHGAASARKGACCAGQDIHDARNVAARLDVPHYVLDYEERFRDRVIKDFARSYARGETPVPCISCNQKIKFADLLQTSEDLGADAMATGHYVSAVHDEAGARLYRAADSARDQSYFLFATTGEQLARLRFPLGGMMKSQVRELAREFGLEVAAKRDSQDICFVPSGHYSELVERLEPSAAAPGDIVDLRGRIVGRHNGVIRFTVGQRKGLGLADPSGEGEPVYVVALDAAANRVIIGPKSALATRIVALRDVNWIGQGFAGLCDLGSLPESGIEVAVRVRSTRPPAAALLRRRADGLEVELAGEGSAVAPGQACVFYASAEAGARVLGGGFIKAVTREGAQAA